MAPRKPEVIRPPKHIRQKVGMTGGLTIEEAVGLSDKAIKPFAESFLKDIESHLAALRTARAAIQSTPDQIGRQRQRIFDAAHEIRGQSGTFGYPLATAVADTLCKYLDGKTDLAADDIQLCLLHVNALLAVFRENLRGEGGKIGDELREMLHLLIRRHKVEDGKAR
ncbi:MAG: hypothetical protein FJX46_02720 [Alphaproteobacteria bacterium]|nr:hypothetical protein [Alphaproteobacteria bacterium]